MSVKAKKGHVDPNHECHNDIEVLLYCYRTLLILAAIVNSKLFVQSSFGIRFLKNW